MEKLYGVVDNHWAEICDSLPLIEELSEDESFPAADLASAIASKCFYHLQEYNDSLRLALNAGKYFDTSVKSEYVDTLLIKLSSFSCFSLSLCDFPRHWRASIVL